MKGIACGKKKRKKIITNMKGIACRKKIYVVLF